MESPSPQLVGQEFVRQYYTLLHERPKYLHRFYSNNSSYIHGGIVEGGGSSQEPAVGQSEIHKRIMALNFSECHTKIRQVDSQATVGGAVVVQVTGELSNNGSPMRRFMQTFVLAPQSPNKYYVHNDIFRYQDEVFPDDSDSGDDEPPIQDAVPVARPAAAGPQSAEQLPAISHVDDSALLQQQLAAAASQPASSVAAAGVESGQASSEVRTGGEPSAAAPYNKKDDQPRSLGSSSAEPKQPKTWSNIIAQPAKPVGTAPAAAVAAAKAIDAPSSRADVAAAAQPPPAVPVHESAAASKAAEQQQQAGAPAEQSEPATSGAGDTADLLEGGGSQEAQPLPTAAVADQSRNKLYYPDSQQVFVGNLPVGSNEQDVRALFSESAEIVSVRVITSISSRTPYAFVVFSGPSAAQRALEKKDYTFKGQFINVEEKRPQQRYPRGGMGSRYGSSSYHYHPRGGGSSGYYNSRSGVGRQGPSGARRGGQLPPSPAS